jgi:hypothetical protein
MTSQLTTTEKEIMEALNERLSKIALGDQELHGYEQSVELVKVAASVCRKKVKEGMDKALGYARVLQSANGAIPWRDVNRYNKEWINENV